MKKISQLFGISSYTYTWSIGIRGYRPLRPMTALDLLKKAHALGVRVLQIADNLPLHLLDDKETGALHAMSKRTGISLEVGTRGLKPAVLNTYLTIAGRLDAKILRILIDDGEYRPDSGRVISILKDFAPRLREKNVVLAIENHDRFKAETYARIIEKTGSGNVGICLDTANSIGACESLESVVDILGPLAVNVHLKDFAIKRLPHRLGFIVEGAPLGGGMLRTEWFLKKMRKFNRARTVILELWTPPEKNLEATIRKEERWARESVEFFRKNYPPLTMGRRDKGRCQILH